MFAPIQVKSSYTLLKSPLKIDNYVKLASQQGYDSLVLADEDVLYGAYEFYEACAKYGIKHPVLGIDLNLQGDGQNEPQKLLLLAQNEQGYHHLVKISSLKLSKNQADIHDNPLTCQVLAPYLSGLAVIVTPFVAAQNSQPKFLATLQQVGAKVFLGIGPQYDKNLLLNSYRLAKEYQLPTLGLAEVEYLTPDAVFEQRVLKALAEDTKVSYLDQNNGDKYLKKPAVYQAEFEQNGMLEAYEQTKNLLENCHFWLKKEQTRLPHYPLAEGMNFSAQTYLSRLCHEGLKRCLNKHPKQAAKYQARLERELAVIAKMGFDDYFLIVAGITNYARDHHITLGPGRGSAAGSLAAYTLRITDVDPLEYGLLFERFLNEERAQMPDIDLDIPDDKRDLLLKYLQKTYGKKHMGQIITFDTFGPKQALRDCGRVFNIPPQVIDTWVKALPKNQSLIEAQKTTLKIQNLISDSPTNALMYQTAAKIEGLPRHYSTHAAGVVLSDRPLADLVPVQLGNDGFLMAQFAKKAVEKAGLLKIDLLGLKNLRVLNTAKDLVNTQQSSKIELTQIPLDDEKTLQLFQRADTEGIFQFDSYGIRQKMRQLAPQNFADIVALNALYRPGPIKNIDTFIARRHRQSQPSYPNQALAKVLKSTYGIIVYQEQVMQVSALMAGFSLGQADILRAAISKKNTALIGKIKDDFIKGSLKRGYSEEEALQVYDYIARFGDYGFNKSHAVAYSKMAFQMAYFKAHYPKAFYCALLQATTGNATKTINYLTAAKKMGVALLFPDINRAQRDFSLVKEGLMFGFSSVKGLRMDFIKQLLIERQAGGYHPYQSLSDFTNRMVEAVARSQLLKQHQKDPDRKKIAASLKPMVEALIYAGAFDSFKQKRQAMLNELDSDLEYEELAGKSQLLLDLLKPKTNSGQKELMDSELLDQEKAHLGLYLSAHPLDRYQKQALLLHTSLLEQLNVNQSAKVLAVVKNVKEITTKQNKPMAFMTLSDQSGELEATIFPRQFARYRPLIKPGQVLVVTGKTQARNDLSLLVDTLIPIQSVRIQYLWLHFEPQITQDQKKALLYQMKKHPGTTPVLVVDEQKKTTKLLDAKFWVQPNEATLSDLQNIIGSKDALFKVT